MGIQGLLPFLKKASRQANIKEFKGFTVAIDSYCWLHRGAFACAEKLALGESTDQYVYYCMKYVNNLLSFGIKPIMVFDGCRLPSKHEVEKTRRERRALNRKKAAQLLSEGKRSEARDCLAQCIDISPQMALHLMIACREKGVDCIVAPYEADAQLAYLNKIGVAQIVITEDSDLVLFGCERIMFKMDMAGNGMLIEKRDLNNAMCLPPEIYTFDKFRQACILSGCDYLQSLPGIGLVKATKVFRLSRQTDIATLIRKIPMTLKMPNLQVSIDYVDGFIKAENSFLYQLVFDPIQRKLCPLNPYPDDINPSDLYYAGPYIDAQKALQIALGNIDINTGELHADFDPDNFKAKSVSWNQDKAPHFQSMWSRSYRPLLEPFKCSTDIKPVEQPNTKGMQVVITMSDLGEKLNKGKRKQKVAADEVVDNSEVDLMNIYGPSGDVELNGSICDSLELQQCSTEISTASQISDGLHFSGPSSKRHCANDMQCELQGNIVNDSSATVESSLLLQSAISPQSLHDDFKPVRNSPRKPSFNKENISDDDESAIPIVDRRSGDITMLSPKDDRCRKSPPKKRNIFAVSSNSQLRPRFSLNDSKTPRLDTEVEVKSRFFTGRTARSETVFFKELRKEHNVPDCSSTFVNPDAVHQRMALESQDDISTREECSVLVPRMSNCHVDASPYRAFSFTKSQNEVVHNFTSPSHENNRPYKIVAPRAASVSYSKSILSHAASESQLKSIEQTKNEILSASYDAEYSDEDPIGSSTPQSKSLTGVRSESSTPASEFNLIKKSDMEIPPCVNKPAVSAVTRISMSLAASKQQKSCTGSGFQSNGCRTSGLSKKKKSSSSGSNDNQLSISKYFESKFAYNRQSSSAERNSL